MLQESASLSENRLKPAHETSVCIMGLGYIGLPTAALSGPVLARFLPRRISARSEKGPSNNADAQPALQQRGAGALRRAHNLHIQHVDIDQAARAASSYK